MLIMEKEIPKGSTREDIKARKKIIGDFYASWIEAHPDKKIWNKSLHAYIHVKFQSINETKGHAALSIKSTLAVFSLTKILKEAYVVEKWAPKYDDLSPYCWLSEVNNGICAVLCRKYIKNKAAR